MNAQILISIFALLWVADAVAKDDFGWSIESRGDEAILTYGVQDSDAYFIAECSRFWRKVNIAVIAYKEGPPDLDGTEDSSPMMGPVHSISLKGRLYWNEEHQMLDFIATTDDVAGVLDVFRGKGKVRFDITPEGFGLPLDAPHVIKEFLGHCE
jgi:hypothetical protein